MIGLDKSGPHTVLVMPIPPILDRLGDTHMSAVIDPGTLMIFPAMPKKTSFLNVYK